MVWDFPEAPHRTRDNTEFPRLMGQNEARLRNGVRAAPGVTARRTRGGDGGGSDPHFLAADAPRGRGRLFMPLFILFPCLWGVAPTTVIPCGKAEMLKSRTRVALPHLVRAIDPLGLLTPTAWHPLLSLGQGNAPSRQTGHAGARTGPSGHRPPPPGSGPHAPGPLRSPPADGPRAEANKQRI